MSQLLTNKGPAFSFCRITIQPRETRDLQAQAASFVTRAEDPLGETCIDITVALTVNYFFFVGLFPFLSDLSNQLTHRLEWR